MKKRKPRRSSDWVVDISDRRVHMLPDSRGRLRLVALDSNGKRVPLPRMNRKLLELFKFDDSLARPSLALSVDVPIGRCGDRKVGNPNGS